MEPRPETEEELRTAIEETRSVIQRIERLAKAGVTSHELEVALDRSIEADLWLKRHGHKGRLGE